MDQFAQDLANRVAILRDSGEPNKAAADKLQAELDDYQASLKAAEIVADIDDTKPLDKLTKDELVALAETHSLDSSGTKADIIDRLTEAGITDT